MTHRHRIITLLILVSLLIAACSPPQAPALSAPTPMKLKVVNLPFLSFAPFFIAQEEGYFAEQELDVEFVDMRQSTEAVPALLQGDLDVLAGFINIGLLNAMAQGEDVRWVADKGYLSTEGCATDNFMTSLDKTVDEALGDPSLVQNLRFSANRASVEGYLFSQLLQPHGLALEDIRTGYIANPAVELDALQNAAVDVAFAGEPWVTRITENGAGRIWLRGGDVAPGFQSAALAFGPNLLKDRETGVRFLIAYLKAVDQLSQGKTDRNVEIIAVHTKLEPDLVRELCWPAFRSDGSIDTNSIAEFANWAVETDQLDQAPDVDQFWDGDFVKRANAALGR